MPLGHMLLFSGPFGLVELLKRQLVHFGIWALFAKKSKSTMSKSSFEWFVFGLFGTVAMMQFTIPWQNKNFAVL